mmetsp:Transcript_89699/g.252916  ORF Transcript_89699/g.252916 Transcript_89699/m.252916 type:complete len:119 (+) Transcript_89699:94-450(+)
MPRSRSRSRDRRDRRDRRRRSPSSSSSRSPPRRSGRGGGDGPKRDRSPVVKVGVYKDIDEEEKRRAACGQPPLSIPEKDQMMRNWFRAQRGEAPLTANDLVGDKGGGKGKGSKGKGKF